MSRSPCRVRPRRGWTPQADEGRPVELASSGVGKLARGTKTRAPARACAAVAVIGRPAPWPRRRSPCSRACTNAQQRGQGPATPGLPCGRTASGGCQHTSAWKENSGPGGSAAKGLTLMPPFTPQAPSTRPTSTASGPRSRPRRRTAACRQRGRQPARSLSPLQAAFLPGSTSRATVGESCGPRWTSA